MNFVQTGLDPETGKHSHVVKEHHKVLQKESNGNSGINIMMLCSSTNTAKGIKAQSVPLPHVYHNIVIKVTAFCHGYIIIN